MRQDIKAGTRIRPVELTPDEITLLRFGSVTRNLHRIHYDTEFARSEGLDGPVVMAQLHGCLFYRAAAEFAGEKGEVVSVGWQNRAPAYAGNRLVVSGTVESVDPSTGHITLSLEERCESPGNVCCRGHAVVTIG